VEERPIHGRDRSSSRVRLLSPHQLQRGVIQVSYDRFCFALLIRDHSALIRGKLSSDHRKSVRSAFISGRVVRFRRFRAMSAISWGTLGSWCHRNRPNQWMTCFSRCHGTGSNRARGRLYLFRRCLGGKNGHSGREIWVVRTAINKPIKARPGAGKIDRISFLRFKQASPLKYQNMPGVRLTVGDPCQESPWPTFK
jgi:hypothetical protein